MKYIYTLFVIFIVNISINSQNFFTPISEKRIQTETNKKSIQAIKYLTYNLNSTKMKEYLKQIPEFKDSDIKTNAPVIELPMSDGKIAKFRIWKSSVMAPELAKKYPELVTYSGQGIDDPYATIKLDFTELGFHAQIKSIVNGDNFIDPYSKTDFSNYLVYNKKDLVPRPINCENKGDGTELLKKNSSIQSITPSVGSEIRIYRLAIACTGEYAISATGLPSPTVAQALSAIVTTVNRVNGVYEQELATRLVLIPNNDIIVFTDPATDPFAGNNDAGILLDESIDKIDLYIGDSNYDIGHTFSTGGGGVAYQGVVCFPRTKFTDINGDYYISKAGGITGSANPVGDAYDIDYVAHEMGHQFGCPHTFNATTSNCGGGNRDDANAVEPGSGVTIMGYAGICSATNDLATNSIPYFHTRSFEVATGYISIDGTCSVNNAVANSAPVVNAGLDYTIPKSTPFKLTGSATDAQGNGTLTYSWEQNDNGPASDWNLPTGNAAIFRNFEPTTEPYRYFPEFSDVLYNTTTIGEILPSYGRTMEFRLTARDNNAGCGGVANDDTIITVSDSSGPFTVTSPSTAVSWAGNSTQTITWNVASTNMAPVNCANVSILLSTDGGLTYPTTLLASTANDGSEVITIPNTPTTNARIMVTCVGNVFYNINPINFIISSALAVDDINASKDVFVVYPNPSKGILNIKFNKEIDTYAISIYDISGKLVYNQGSNKPNNDNISSFNLGKLNNGEYIINIKSNSLEKNIKWMKK